jgi:hypothetical protein
MPSDLCVILTEHRMAHQKPARKTSTAVVFSDRHRREGMPKKGGEAPPFRETTVQRLLRRLSLSDAAGFSLPHPCRANLVHH